MRLRDRQPFCIAASFRRRVSPATRSMDRARSSAGEHYLDMVGVTGSIPVAPTSLISRLVPSRTCSSHSLSRPCHNEVGHGEHSEAWR